LETTQPNGYHQIREVPTAELKLNLFLTVLQYWNTGFILLLLRYLSVVIRASRDREKRLFDEEGH